MRGMSMSPWGTIGLTESSLVAARQHTILQSRARACWPTSRRCISMVKGWALDTAPLCVRRHTCVLLHACNYPAFLSL